MASGVIFKSGALKWDYEMVKSKRFKIITYAIICVAIVAIAIVIYEHPEQPENPDFLIGNLNGYKIKVPLEFKLYPPEYAGESVWDIKSIKKIKRDYSSSIDSFSIAVRWPSLESPINNNNYESFKSRNEPNGSRAWLEAEVQSWYENLDDLQRIKFDNYRINHAKGYAKLIQSKLFNKEIPIKSENKMVIQPNLFYGLNVAVFSGPDELKPSHANYRIYWEGDLNKYQDTFIECPNGKFSNLITPLIKCTINTEIPELQSYLTIYISEKYLADWKSIRDSLKNRILSYRI